MFFEGVVYCKKKIACRLADCVKTYCGKLKELPDSPQKIIKGVALGFAFDFLPIPVISIPLSYLAARLARCNPVAAVATVVFFKLAVPFFYTLNIFTGNVLLGDMPGLEVAVSGDSLLSVFLKKLVEHGYPFLIGSLLNAALAWVTVYLSLWYLLERRR
ncbi:MAG: hypothetical protein A4E55_00041 [Pelotomaculum sp. PtaU1.Bin035]|nr:MAG: hypothetical protein A4E55_00041 [Pelotomaculum sp. PtaU1.Bin035]